MQIIFKSKFGELLREVRFRASRSSGPGGQSVNKVNTKVELYFDIEASLVLGAEEKDVVRAKLARRINANGELYLSCQVYRSQVKNKEECMNKFLNLLSLAFSVDKKRIPSKVTLASKIKRLESKRLQSEKKKLRKKL